MQTADPIAPRNPVPRASVAGASRTPRARTHLENILADRKRPLHRRLVAIGAAASAVSVVGVLAVSQVGRSPSAPTPNEAPTTWGLKATVTLIRPAGVEPTRAAERLAEILRARADAMGYPGFRVDSVRSGELDVFIPHASDARDADELLWPADLRILDVERSFTSESQDAVRLVQQFGTPNGPAGPNGFALVTNGAKPRLIDGPLPSRERLLRFRPDTPRGMRIVRTVAPFTIVVRTEPRFPKPGGDRSGRWFTALLGDAIVDPGTNRGVRLLTEGRVAVSVDESTRRRVQDAQTDLLTAFMTTANVAEEVGRVPADPDLRFTERGEIVLETTPAHAVAIVRLHAAGGFDADWTISRSTRVGTPPGRQGEPVTAEGIGLAGPAADNTPTVAPNGAVFQAPPGPLPQEGSLLRVIDVETPLGRYQIFSGLDRANLHEYGYGSRPGRATHSIGACGGSPARRQLFICTQGTHENGVGFAIGRAPIDAQSVVGRSPTVFVTGWAANGWFLLLWQEAEPPVRIEARDKSDRTLASTEVDTSP